MLVFTFPDNRREFPRLSPNDPGTGDYHIRTGLHVPRVDRARDHRDVFVNWSGAPGAWSEPARVQRLATHLGSCLNRSKADGGEQDATRRKQQLARPRSSYNLLLSSRGIWTGIS